MKIKNIDSKTNKIRLISNLMFSKKTKLETILYGKRGITLIALIITVLILLILTGVTLSLTMRRRRYNNKSKRSKRSTKNI